MKVQLKNVRIAFAQLFEPKAGESGGEPKYSACFIIDPKSPNAKAIDEAIAAVAKEKWGAKAGAIMERLVEDKKVTFQKKPRKSRDGAVYEGFEGMYSINASNKAAPLVIDRDKTELSARAGKPYSGCYVNATIDVWAQDNSFGQRINASLGGVQFVKDGDAFGGGAPTSVDEFEDLSNEEDSLIG